MTTEERGDLIEQARLRLRFFLACASDQNPHGPEESHSVHDELKIYDNSTLRVSDELRFLEERMGATYELYLGVRFQAFAIGDGLTSGALGELVLSPGELSVGDDECLRLRDQLFDLLVEQRAAEERALVRRLQQMPREVVVSFWYLDIEEFRRWEDRALRSAAATSRDVWLMECGSSFSALGALGPSVDIGEPKRAAAEAVHQALSQRLWTLAGSLRGESSDSVAEDHFIESADLADPLAYRHPGVDRAPVVRVASLMAGSLSDSSVEPSDLLLRFATALAAAVDCVFCDVLRVEPGDVLRPIVNSHPAADMDKLREETYRIGQGITGSAALLPPNAARRFVGTNHLAGDPRQSPSHTNTYSAVLNLVLSDFWVFPIYNGDQLYGLFRVVNRTPDRWLPGGVPWSQAMLRDIQDISYWFEAVVLPRVVAARVGVRTALESGHSGAVAALRSGCRLDWIDEDFLVQLVTHMASVVHRKIEKNSLGCCIGVFSQIAPVKTALPAYNAVGEVTPKSLEDAATYYYQRVSPLAGMFLFDASGTPHGVATLQLSSLSGFECARELTQNYRKGVVFLLERNQDCIRVIAKNEFVADYYLSDATGVWTLRNYESQIELLRQSVPAAVDPDDATELFRKAIQLSYHRIGSMLILADELPDSVQLEQGEERRDLFLSSITEVAFSDLARVDGAIRVIRGGEIRQCGAIVRTRLSPYQPRVSARAAGGSRHNAAEAVSVAAPDALVIVVSENRPISVLAGGTYLMSRQ